MSKREVLGWAAAVNKHGDSSSRCHLLVSSSGVAVSACGSKGRTSGQVHKKPPEYAPHCCKSCLQSKEAQSC